MVGFVEVECDKVILLRITGKLTYGEGASDFREKIKDLINKGKKFLLIDLSSVSYIDASGIGELVAAFALTANRGGNLKLLSPTKRIVDTLSITKLYTIFEVYQDEKNALKSF